MARRRFSPAQEPLPRARASCCAADCSAAPPGGQLAGAERGPAGKRRGPCHSRASAQPGRDLCRNAGRPLPQHRRRRSLAAARFSRSRRHDLVADDSSDPARTSCMPGAAPVALYRSLDGGDNWSGCRRRYRRRIANAPALTRGCCASRSIRTGPTTSMPRSRSAACCAAPTAARPGPTCRHR